MRTQSESTDVILLITVFWCWRVSVAGFLLSNSPAAPQFAAEEEGVARLALSGQETLESSGGTGLSCKGGRGLLPSVNGI